MRDFTENSALLSNGLATMLEHDPIAFDVIFFKAIVTSIESVIDELGLVDEVGSIEGSEKSIDYAEPIAARAKEQGAQFLSMFANEMAEFGDAMTSENDLVLMLSVPVVPKQSIVTWTEQAGDGKETEVAYMVWSSKPFGKAPVAGYVHYCKPLNSVGEEDGL